MSHGSLRRRSGKASGHAKKASAIVAAIVTAGVSTFVPSTGAGAQDATDPFTTTTDGLGAADSFGTADTLGAGTDTGFLLDTMPTDLGAISPDPAAVDPQMAGVDSLNQSLMTLDNSIAEFGGAVQSLAAPSAMAALAAAPTGPEAPTPIYTEDFENVGASPTRPVSLSSYTNSKTGTRYTASPYWLNAGYCNGFVTSYSSPLLQRDIDSTYCGRNGSSYWSGDYDAVRIKALALGSLSQGGNTITGLSSGQGNHALSTNTSGGTPSGVMFQTRDNILLSPSTDGRFYAFSVDAAATGCSELENPKMLFQLIQNGQVLDLPLDGSIGRIDPCKSPGSRDFRLGSYMLNAPTWVTDGRAGTFYSGAFALDGQASIGLVLQNYSTASSQGAGIGNSPANTPGYNRGSTNGNDGAIDNIRIVDVTPKMAKSFDPIEESVGYASTMTLTINNRSDLGKKQGWGFTDTLPAGLKFAENTIQSTSNTCKTVEANGITVDVQNGTLTVKDGVLDQGQASCEIKIKVTSTVTSVSVVYL